MIIGSRRKQLLYQEKKECGADGVPINVRDSEESIPEELKEIDTLFATESKGKKKPRKKFNPQIVTLGTPS